MNIRSVLVLSLAFIFLPSIFCYGKHRSNSTKIAVPASTGGGERGSGLKRGTMVLMADKTEKPVEQIKVGEMVLDHKLMPTKVVGVLEKFFLNNSFYGFEEDKYFFTKTHQLVGTVDDENLQIYVQNLKEAFEENPLLAYLKVKSLPNQPELYEFNSKSTAVDLQDVKLLEDPQKYPNTTLVYIINVESEHGTYISNGFVSRHEIPPFQFWPNTMPILMGLAADPEIQQVKSLQYNLETLKKLSDIVKKVYPRLESLLNEHKVHNPLKNYNNLVDGTSFNNNGTFNIYDNPVFSAFAMDVYGKLGPKLAEVLESKEIDPDHIIHLQELVYLDLKKYFVAELKKLY